GFAQIFTDVGVGGSIILRQENTPAELSSLHLLNFFAGVVVFVLQMAGAALIVLFFDEPRLASVLPLVAVLFVISSFGQQFHLLLQKELAFSKLAVVELLSAAAGTVVAVGGALNGFGVYALALGQLTLVLTTTVSLVFIGRRDWRPKLR